MFKLFQLAGNKKEKNFPFISLQLKSPALAIYINLFWLSGPFRAAFTPNKDMVGHNLVKFRDVLPVTDSEEG